jgi:VWFA-related protein
VETMRRRSFLLGAPAAWGARLAAQSSIAVDVRLVQVTFSVRSAQGAIAPDLTDQDFEIFENGEPQRITRFTHGDDQPLRLGVLVDGSGSQDEFIERHRRDLADFLESALEPKDGAFLLGFGNTLRLVCDFANDAAAMMAHLEYYRDRPGRRHGIV